MNINELHALQAPLKERYKQNPESAVIPTRADGIIEGEDIFTGAETNGVWDRIDYPAIISKKGRAQDAVYDRLFLTV